LARLRQPWSDRRAALTLGAASLLVCLIVVGMVVFVAVHAWPTIEHNGGFAWLGSGGNLDSQLQRMFETGPHPPASAYHLRAWPVIYGTLLTTSIALLIALPLALLSSIFIVEFAPSTLRRVMMLVPFVGNHLVTGAEKTSVQDTVELTGASLLVASVVLAVMITPIMVALISEALTGVPASWREGAMALGVHRLRATLAVSLKAIRPAIVAAAALALVYPEPGSRTVDLPV
jgi:phosphate transport system permease protein